MTSTQILRICCYALASLCFIQCKVPLSMQASKTTRVVSDTIWRKANLTHYESYPAPDSPECIEYNGCTWAGQFAFIEGQQTLQWVMQHNIIAIHAKDARKYKLKTFRIRQGNKQIDAVVYDCCADSDCKGCCTANANSGNIGFLIDMETHTLERFNGDDGVVEWICLDCD